MHGYGGPPKHPDLLFEPDTKFVKQYGLLPARTIFGTDQRLISIRVLNPQVSSVKIPICTQMGSAETFDNVIY